MFRAKRLLAKVHDDGTIMIISNPLKVTWEKPHRHPSWQRMDSLAAYAICTMPTADESNHLAAGTTHPHCSTSAT